MMPNLEEESILSLQLTVPVVTPAAKGVSFRK
jgi:hypothetical protein